MHLEECFQKGLIKKTQIDKELIVSLIEMSHIKEKTVTAAPLNEENISAYVSLAYDSLRELLEALCILHGYKVLSYVCVAELLNEYLEEFDYHEFNELRSIRNGINYYGKKITFIKGEKVLGKIFLLRKSIFETYFTTS